MTTAHLRLAAATIGLMAIPAAVTLALRAGPAYSLAALTRDPAATTGAAVWIGFLSTIGVLYWTSAAAVALFSSGLARSKDGDARFLLITGLLLAVAALDDMFLLHEDVLPSVGVPEDVVKALYPLAAVAYAAVFRRRFRGLDLAVGLAAVALLGLSLLIDAFTHGGDTSSVVEDGLKFAGICLVLVVVVRLARTALQRRGPPAPLIAEQGDHPPGRTAATS